MEIMGQVSSSSKTPRSPMSIVRAHWTPGSKRHTIYFQPGSISGPGYGDDNPAILAELVPLLKVIEESMGGADFFVSMIPEADYSFANARIPDSMEVPAFGRAFEPIASVLAANGIENDCDIEISVRTGRGGNFGDSTTPCLELSVYERIPAESGKYERRRVYLPVSLDTNGNECKSILAWYSGATHGMVSWKWKRQLDVQSAEALATDLKPIA